ncbi:hypothetical protein WDU94_007936 [Cyamophila willieti]
MSNRNNPRALFSSTPVVKSETPTTPLTPKSQLSRRKSLSGLQLLKHHWQQPTMSDVFKQDGPCLQKGLQQHPSSKHPALLIQSQGAHLKIVWQTV